MIKKFWVLLFALLLAAPAAGQFGNAVGPAVTSVGSAAVGQIPGTATNDSPCVGCVGEYKESLGSCGGVANVTISNASPAVFTATAHGLSIGAAINFTTSGALPTPLAVGTNYYVSVTGFSANSFSVSTTAANALAGTNVNTSSAGSGTHNGVVTVLLSAPASGTDTSVAAIALTAGNWDVFTTQVFIPGATTNFTQLQTSVSATDNTRDATTGRLGSISPASAGLVSGGNSETLTAGPVNVKLSGTTNYFSVTRPAFTVAAMNVCGSIRAVRTR